MTTTTSRPVALKVIPENIPQALKDCHAWVCWRYEWVLNKHGNGKWAKVPKIPGTQRNANHSNPKTWRSFDDAIQAYQQAPDYYDGIFVALSPPYVGGDFDHSLDDTGNLSDFARDHLPATYAEISPSETGVKYIALGSLPRARKTPRAELYACKRFFAITGHILPGQPCAIIEAQDKIDGLLAALGNSTRVVTDGSAGGGSRAEVAAQIEESEWEAARQLIRTQVPQLLARVRAAAKEETQLGYLLREDYAGFHQRWPFVGLYRADGSLDDSQVRAVAANGIKGRGFSFPEYVAVMSHLYAAPALAKWGTKQLWREELAALWFKATEPRFAPRPKPKAAKVPRGRAGDHAALVERVYTLIQEHRAGDTAILHISDLAQALGAHRRTVSSILGELRDSKRISTRRLGQYGGLAVTFSDVIYSDAPAAALPAPTPESAPADTPPEETKATTCVSSEESEADHISPELPQSLAALITEAFDAIDGRKTRKRIVWYVAQNDGRVWTDEELDEAIEQERRRRRLAHLPTLKPAGLRAEIRLAEHLADKSKETGDQGWRWWLFYRDQARRELASRPPEAGRPKGGRKNCEKLPDLRRRTVTIDEALLLAELDEARRTGAARGQSGGDSGRAAECSPHTTPTVPQLDMFAPAPAPASEATSESAPGAGMYDPRGLVARLRQTKAASAA